MTSIHLHVVRFIKQGENFYLLPSFLDSDIEGRLSTINRTESMQGYHQNNKNLLERVTMLQIWHSVTNQVDENKTYDTKMMMERPTPPSNSQQ
jgi:hypothetical protein